jgi:hypothetical protein
MSKSTDIRLESWGPGQWQTPDRRYRVVEERRVRRIGTNGVRTGWTVVENPHRTVGRARKFNEARELLANELAERKDG